MFANTEGETHPNFSVHSVKLEVKAVCWLKLGWTFSLLTFKCALYKNKYVFNFNGID